MAWWERLVFVTQSSLSSLLLRVLCYNLFLCVLCYPLLCATISTHGEIEIGRQDNKLVSNRPLHLEEHTNENAAGDTSVILRSVAISTDCPRNQ